MPRATGSSQELAKPYREILEEQIASGVQELERSSAGLLLSGLSAGLDLGFSTLLMATMLTLAGDTLPRPVTEILVANLYAVGFIFVIIGRSELFTEHTTLTVLPVLDGRASIAALGRLWGLIYVSNLVGATIFALIAATVGPALGVANAEAFGALAHGLVDHPALVIVASGVLAGWLMGLLSWLVTAGRDTTSQILIVWIVTTSIGLAHLHHCIAGTAEVVAGMVAADLTLGDAAHFLTWATLGNIFGGVVFVALMKYGHVTQGGKKK